MLNDIPSELALALLKGEQLCSKNEAEAIRVSVAPGEYAIDATIRVRGKLSVAEDKFSAVSTAVPWRDMCAVLFSKLNGVTVESVLREALKGSGKISALAEQADEQAKKAMETLVAGSKRPVRGAVKSRVEITEVK